MSFRKFAAIVCICLEHLVSATAFCEGARDTPVVKILSGRVAGFTKDGVDQYLGIPYAAPPTGPLRWKPAAPAKPWTGTFSATRFGKTCAQNPNMGVFAAASESEDCLHLNIFASKKPSTSGHKKPVMFWIYGGGLSAGESDDYDGSKLAADGDTVVVTFNYRLGVLGFFAHPALAEKGHHLANYGFLDQIQALKWVKQNIEYFGGDPINVTVFGESAGGASTVAHIVSPLSAGLFQNAISLSGGAIDIKYPNFGNAYPLHLAADKATQFATAAGCTNQSAACLRELTVPQILAAQQPYIVNEFILDGYTLPSKSLDDAFTDGHYNHVTWVQGSDRDEWRWAVGFAENGSGKPMTAADYLPALTKYFGEERAKIVLAEYPLSDFNTPSEAYAATTSDSQFICDGRKLMQLVAGTMPVYGYEFADQTAPSYLEPTSFPLGAAHTLELQYIFPHYHGARGIVHELNPMQQKLSDKMVYWFTHVSEARNGALWPDYDPKQDNFMSFVLPKPHMQVGRYSKVHKCDFWDKMSIY